PCCTGPGRDRRGTRAALGTARKGLIPHATPSWPALGRLPSGTVLDGERVVLRDGRADFPALLGRQQRCGPIRFFLPPTAIRRSRRHRVGRAAAAGTRFLFRRYLPFGE